MDRHAVCEQRVDASAAWTCQCRTTAKKPGLFARKLREPRLMGPERASKDTGRFSNAVDSGAGLQ